MGALQPGQMLEGTSYQVVRELGAGGMGVVYEIEHVRLKKRYVAKVMHEMIKEDESALRRMEREAQVLASLSHPNVVQVHDVGTTADGTHYFVMEKLEGVDLRRFMKRAMPRAQALSIMADVLDALDYVHKKGVVHRDIKPENIFLSDEPRGTTTKVLDFGIVHIFDSDGRLSSNRITKTGGFAGTLYYAAPEQMQGKAPGPPCDVYAVGLVLFELLAGKGPFDDDPGVGLSRCFKPAPHLHEFAPTVPREVGDTIAMALLQDPTSRPAAGWLAAELRRLQPIIGASPEQTPAGPASTNDAVGLDVDDLLNGMSAPAAPKPALGTGPENFTDVPPTPLMANAPPRPAGGGHASSAIGQAPTMASASPQAGSQPDHVNMTPGPQTVPQRYSTPAGVGPMHAVSSPPVSPRIAAGPISPRLDTAPGLYATVDQSAVSTPTPPMTSNVGLIAGVAGAILAALAVLGGVLIYKSQSTAANDSPPAASATTVAATAPPSATEEPPVRKEPAAAPAATSAAPSETAPPTAATSAAPTTQPAAPIAATAKGAPPPVKPTAAPVAPKPSASAKSQGGYIINL